MHGDSYCTLGFRILQVHKTDGNIWWSSPSAFSLSPPSSGPARPFLYGDTQGVAGPSQAGRIGAGTGGAGFLPGMDRAGLAQNAAGRERLYGQGNASAFTAGRGAFAGAGIGGATVNTQLENYILANTTNETWILAVPSSQTAAGLIIQTGKPVMAIGGFSGSDRILNITSLTALIQEGKVRDFLTGGMGGGGTEGGMNAGNSEIFSWVSAHCTPVDLSFGNETGLNATSTAGSGTAESLYDCAGAAGSG